MKWFILVIIIEVLGVIEQTFGFGEVPTYYPTETAVPSPSPSENPTESPTSSPTESPAPSPSPSETPTQFPTYIPTHRPSFRPSNQPRITESPTSSPTESPAPSPSPSETPTQFPTYIPTHRPSFRPTNQPTIKVPSVFPTPFPTSTPTYRHDSNGELNPIQTPQNVPSPVFMTPSVFPPQRLSPTPHLGTTAPSSSSRYSEPSIPTSIYEQQIANTTLAIVGASGVMEDDTITIFEELGLQLLNELFPRIPEVNIDFLFIQVDTQLFRVDTRSVREGTEFGELIISFKAAANISTRDVGGCGFHFSIDSFFASQSTEFIRRLQRADTFFGEFIQLNGVNDTEIDSAESFFTAPVSVLLGLSFVSFLIIGSNYVKRRNEGILPQTFEKYPVGLDGLKDDNGLLLTSCSATAPVSREHIDQLSENNNSSAYHDYEELMEADDRDLYDGKEIFISLSDTSLSWRNPKPKSGMWSQRPSPKSVRSGYSSTIGSRPAGIDIEFSESEVTSISPIPNDRYSRPSSRYSVGGMSALTHDEFVPIHERPRNLFDDTYEMHSSDSESTYDAGSPSKQRYGIEQQSLEGTNSYARVEKARNNKRALERTLEESKMRTKCQSGPLTCQTKSQQVPDSVALGNSVHDLRLDSIGEWEPHEFVETHYPRSTAPISIATSRIMGHNDRDKDYPNPFQSQGETSHLERVKVQNKKVKPNNRKNKYLSLKKLPPQDELQKSEKSQSGKGRGQRRYLFGLRKKESKWDKKDGFAPLSPSGRHRHNGNDTLVTDHPSRYDNSFETFQENNGDDEHSEELLLPKGESSDDRHASSPKGPSRHRKCRPPKLDLDERDEGMSHDFLPDSFSHLNHQYYKSKANEQGIAQCPDPVGHTLSSYRAASLMTGAKTEYTDPPSKAYYDPPTASEHKRRRKESTREKENRVHTRTERSTERLKENRNYSEGSGRKKETKNF